MLCLSLTTSSRHWSPAFFSKARTASTIGTILFFAALFPYFAVDQDGVSSNQRRAACLLPPTCLALGTVPLREFEDSGVVRMFLYCALFSALLLWTSITCVRVHPHPSHAAAAILCAR